jgi:hypothetical protein
MSPTAAAPRHESITFLTVEQRTRLPHRQFNFSTRHFAANIARLPELLGKGEPQQG